MTTISAMVLGIIIIFVLVMTYFAFTRRNLPISFVAAITWLLLLIFTRSNPLPNMPTGSYGDELILWVCILMIPLLLYNGWIKYREDKTGTGKNTKRYAYYNNAGEYVGRYEQPIEQSDNHYETPDEYRERLHDKIMIARKSRREHRGYRR